MAMFEPAISKAFALEGGYNNISDDPGGPTNMGISLRYLRTLSEKFKGIAEGDVNGDGVIDIKDIKEMTRDQAAAIYRKEWWDRYRYGQLAPQELADKVFCTAINMGAAPANKIFQHALLACGVPNIVEDGVLGPVCIQAASRVNSRLGSGALLAAYRAAQWGYYRELIATHPQFKKFQNGWKARAYA